MFMVIYIHKSVTEGIAMKTHQSVIRTVGLVVLAAAVLVLFGCRDKNGGGSFWGGQSGEEYKLTLNQADYTFGSVGEVFELVCSVSPNVSESLSYTFTSSNTDIVSVDASGYVTAVNNGVSAVTASVFIKGIQYSSVCAFSVEDPFGDDEMTEEEKNLYSDPGPAVPAVPAPVIDSDGFLCSDNLKEYFVYNSDAVAWLYVAGTKINIPVAQSDVSSPELYLSYGFNRYPKYSGCAFLDYRSSVKGKGYVTDQQTVIYGHARGTDVFDALERTMIKDEWYNNTSNRYIYLNSLLEDTVWEIFGCYYADLSDASVLNDLTTLNYSMTMAEAQSIYTAAEIQSAIRLGTIDRLLQDSSALYKNMLRWRSRMAGDDSRYAAFQSILGKRDYASAVIQSGDRVLTLMTCADSGTPIRFVVQARLVAVREK